MFKYYITMMVLLCIVPDCCPADDITPPPDWPEDLTFPRALFLLENEQQFNEEYGWCGNYGRGKPSTDELVEKAQDYVKMCGYDFAQGKAYIAANIRGVLFAIIKQGRSREEVERVIDSFVSEGFERDEISISELKRLHIAYAGSGIERDVKNKGVASQKAIYDCEQAIEGYELLELSCESILPARDPHEDKKTIDLIQRADEKGIIDQLTERRFGGEVNEALIEYCRTKADDGTLNELLDEIFPYLDDPAVAEYLISLMKKGAKNSIIENSLWALKNYSNQEEIAGKLAEIYINGYYHYDIGSYMNHDADIDYATRKKLLKKMERANPNLRVNWEVINRKAKKRGELIEVDGELVVPPGKREKEPVDHGEARPGAPSISVHEKKSDELEKTDVESDSSWLKAGLIFFVIVILALLPILALKKKRKTD